MKVTYILTEFPNSTETFVRDEIQELIAKGINIQILARNKEKNFIEVPDNPWINVPVVYFNKSIALKKRFLTLLFFVVKSPYRFFREYKFYKNYRSSKKEKDYMKIIYLSWLVIKNKSEHIHAHFAAYSSEMALFVSMLSGVPYSFTAHAHDIFVKAEPVEQKIRKAKFVVTISNYNKQYICDNFVKDNRLICKKIHVIHCGIRTDRLNSVSDDNNDNKGQIFKIVSAGRLVEKKGTEFLVRACKELLESGTDNFHCLIIGDGPLRYRLKELIEQLELEKHVDLYGMQSHEKTISLMRTADVFVLPCVRAENNDTDGIPVVLMEAMALKVPVISTRLSGIPELVHNDGLLCKTAHPNEIAGKIKKIINMDIKEKNLIRNQLYETIIKEFSLSTEVERLAKLFST